MTEDVRVGAWSLRATAGTDVAFEATFEAGFDISGGVVVYIGGSVSPDPTVLTGATAFAASEVGQVASFTLTIPDDVSGSTPLRMTVGGSLLTVGRLHVARTGTPAPESTVTVVTEPVQIALTVLGTGTGGGGGPVGVADLTDVDLTGLADGEVLAYDDGTSTWVPVAQSGGGGGGAVDSVNGQTGVVSLDSDDIDDTGQAHQFATAAQLAKVNHLAVTQAVDLDAIETRVNSLDAAVVLRGSWDASAGTFPGGGTAQAGDSYIVSVAGTVNAVAFAVGDRIVAILDNASTATYAANWLKLDYTDQVLSVDGRTGAVTLGDLYAALAHGHAISDVTDLQAELNGKASLVDPEDFTGIIRTSAAGGLGDVTISADMVVNALIDELIGEGTSQTEFEGEARFESVDPALNYSGKLTGVAGADSLGVDADLGVAAYNTAGGFSTEAKLEAQADATTSTARLELGTATITTVDNDGVLRASGELTLGETAKDGTEGLVLYSPDASVAQVLATDDDTLTVTGERLAKESALTDHVDDAADAHQASAIGSTPTGDLTGTDVQANLTELDARLTGLLAFTPDYLQDYCLIIEDFVGGTVTTGQLGTHGWETQLAGTGVVAAAASDLGDPGVVNLTVSAVADNTAINLSPVLFTGSPEYIWEGRVRVSAVASAAQDFTCRCGLLTTALVAPTDGAWFQASYNAGDTSWHCMSRNASGTIQDTDTGIDPTSATWQRLRIISDGAGTLYFYINDTLVATHTTVSAAGVLTPRFGNVKGVGSTARNFRIGYSYLKLAVTR